MSNIHSYLLFLFFGDYNYLFLLLIFELSQFLNGDLTQFGTMEAYKNQRSHLVTCCSQKEKNNRLFPQ